MSALLVPEPLRASISRMSLTLHSVASRYGQPGARSPAMACSETLEPRVMQVLVALARVKGEILSRDDLIESCWDGVVVGEDAINRCIGRLRKAAEASGNEFSIETVPRVGYRLKEAKTEAVPQGLID